MDNLETDVSYLLGSYVGVVRKIELELDRLIKRTTPSTIEEHLQDIVEEPEEAIRVCKEIISREAAALKVGKREDLIQEGQAILQQINQESLKHITLDMPNFLHGYHAKIPD